MADRCPHCGAELPAPLPGSCPECLRTLAADTGITATPAPPVDGSFAEGTPPEAPLPRFEEETPSIVKAETTGPSCPALLLVGLSTFLCASQGAATNFGKPGGINFKSEETVFGAIVGFVIGLALAVDHWFFQRKLNKPAQIPGEDQGEPPGPAPRPNDGISLAMVLLPIVAGVLMWFASPLRLTQMHVSLIGSGAVVATAALGYFSIRQMALRENRAASHYHGGLSSPAFMYLAMLFLWIILYPVHFVIRWRMGGRNLIIPGLIATVIYCAPMAQPFLVEAELPPVDDAEVLTLVRQMVEDEPMMKPATVRNPAEVSFDAAQQKRMGRCTISTKFGEEPVSYKIDWQNRQQGIWQVQVLDRLPFVDAPEVLELVRNDLAFRPLNGRIRLDPVVLRNPVQTGYDAAKQQRTGRVTASAGRGNADVTYLIIWADAERKTFNVQVNGKVP
jgi:hypothetical protein